MKLYTRTGDGGETSLFGGGRASKRDLRVAAYGDIDELNAALGVARAANPSAQGDQWLERLQNQLFRLGADLATPLDAKTDWIQRMTAEETRWLEAGIDRMSAELPPLRNFILPGGAPPAAQLQLARAVCRRAERAIVALTKRESINPEALPYVNRLSDWLFALARYENMRAGESESRWTQNE